MKTPEFNVGDRVLIVQSKFTERVGTVVKVVLLGQDAVGVRGPNRNAFWIATDKLRKVECTLKGTKL